MFDANRRDGRLFQWKNVVVPPDGKQTFERRADQRIPVGLGVTARRVNQDRVYRLLTQDLSPGGLRFLSSMPVKVGEILELLVPLHVAQDSISIVGKVMWCRGTPESPLGTYEGGIVFVRISQHSHERLTRFLDELQTAGWTEAAPTE